MISLVKLILEDNENLPAVQGNNAVANVPQVDRVETDLQQIIQAFAECLNIDPSTVRAKKLEKASIEDYGNMSMSGDVAIECDAVREMGDERVAELLNRFGFLEDIQINGQRGRDLSALCFGDRNNGGNAMAAMIGGGSPGVGDIAGGDIIITSKITEFRLLPFLATMGINTANCEDAMEDYWSHIAGRAVSFTYFQRQQALLGTTLRPRLGMRQMGRLPGRNAQQIGIPRGGHQQLGGRRR